MAAELARQRQTGILHDPQRLEAILAEHTEIAEAVRDGDVSRLLDAIKVHLAGTERALAFTAD
jgi:DNA-binding FadR family transcriptional regulator